MKSLELQHYQFSDRVSQASVTPNLATPESLLYLAQANRLITSSPHSCAQPGCINLIIKSAPVRLIMHCLEA